MQLVVLLVLYGTGLRHFGPDWSQPGLGVDYWRVLEHADCVCAVRTERRSRMYLVNVLNGVRIVKGAGC